MFATESTDFAKLPTTLKRFNLNDKLQLAEEYSRKVMHPDVQCDPSKIRKQLLPWELECFVMLAIKAKEWKYDSLDQVSFFQIMNAIREAKHPELQKKAENKQFAQWLTMVLSATQFDYEEPYWQKCFRLPSASRFRWPHVTFSEMLRLSSCASEDMIVSSNSPLESSV